MPDRLDAPTTGSGVTRYVIAAVILGVVFVILAAQNSATAPVELLFWNAEPPLYGVAAVSALFGAAAAEVLAGIWRHRRHIRNRERLELSELRTDTAGTAGTADTASPQPPE